MLRELLWQHEEVVVRVEISGVEIVLVQGKLDFKELDDDFQDCVFGSDIALADLLERNGVRNVFVNEDIAEARFEHHLDREDILEVGLVK